MPPLFFFFNDTATTEIYTLSLHDALPIFRNVTCASALDATRGARSSEPSSAEDRKSTRLNSSHGYISYAVFCLKKKKERTPETLLRWKRREPRPGTVCATAHQQRHKVL